jgi:hypothetical protein
MSKDVTDKPLPESIETQLQAAVYTAFRDYYELPVESREEEHGDLRLFTVNAVRPVLASAIAAARLEGEQAAKLDMLKPSLQSSEEEFQSMRRLWLKKKLDDHYNFCYGCTTPDDLCLVGQELRAKISALSSTAPAADREREVLEARKDELEHVLGWSQVAWDNEAEEGFAERIAELGRQIDAQASRKEGKAQ